MSEFIIQGETLAALGDKFRSLTGSSEPMTLVEMINAEVSVGQTPSGSADRITAVINMVYQQGDPVRTAVIDPAVLTSLPGTDETICGIEQHDVLSLSLPLLTEINNNDHSGFTNLRQADYPACTAVADYAFYECNGLTSVSLPSCTTLGEYAFKYCSSLEEITLNTACAISFGAFEGVLDPDTKTLRIYLNGDTVGTCDTSAFWQINNGGGSCDSGSGSGDETEVRAVPGLEIYVPEALVNDFKTTWANGIFAENIFPMSSIEA